MVSNKKHYFYGFLSGGHNYFMNQLTIENLENANIEGMSFAQLFEESIQVANVGDVVEGDWTTKTVFDPMSEEPSKFYRIIELP